MHARVHTPQACSCHFGSATTPSYYCHRSASLCQRHHFWRDGALHRCLATRPSQVHGLHGAATCAALHTLGSLSCDAPSYSGWHPTGHALCMSTVPSSCWSNLRCKGQYPGCRPSPTASSVADAWLPVTGICTHCYRRRMGSLYPPVTFSPLLQSTYGVEHSAHTLSHTARMPCTSIQLIQCWESDCHCFQSPIAVLGQGVPTPGCHARCRPLIWCLQNAQPRGHVTSTLQYLTVKGVKGCQSSREPHALTGWMGMSSRVIRPRSVLCCAEWYFPRQSFMSG